MNPIIHPEFQKENLVADTQNFRSTFWLADSQIRVKIRLLIRMRKDLSQSQSAASHVVFPPYVIIDFSEKSQQYIPK